jgi:hydroxymethylglutaryl-CoA lyase
MKKIQIHEVGPRDGLQVEDVVVPTDIKIQWLERLFDSGVDMIQLGSFVHPRRVPQMADTEALFRHFRQDDDSQDKRSPILTALVLNEKGVDRGFACGVDYFCMGVSASETHSKKNTGMSTREAFERTIKMARRVIDAGKQVQVSVQSAFGCGYEGPISEQKVLDLVKGFLDSGLKTISLADTAGHANPEQVKRLFEQVFAADPEVDCACHLHNTYGLGLTNAYAAFTAGVTCFESAFAGLGGCPFTAVAGGNVCTEDLVHMFHGMKLRSDIELDPFIDVAKSASEFLGRELPGTIHKTGPIPYLAKNT